MDFNTAINENYGLHLTAETAVNLEAGEFPNDAVSDKFHNFVSSLDWDQYENLLSLYPTENWESVEDWVESTRKFMDSLSDEQKRLYEEMN